MSTKMAPETTPQSTPDKPKESDNLLGEFVLPTNTTIKRQQPEAVEASENSRPWADGEYKAQVLTMLDKSTQNARRMDGPTNGNTDGQMDLGTERRTDGRTDERVNGWNRIRPMTGNQSEI